MQEKTLEELKAKSEVINDHLWYVHPSDIIEALEKAREEGREEERQFILNVLDGIDIADKQMGIVGGTKAIRLALQSRIIN